MCLPLLICYLRILVFASCFTTANLMFVYAAEEDLPNSVLASEPGDLVTAGEEVSVMTEVQGDLIAAGEKVTVNETVHGYVLVTGGNIALKGEVENDLWTAGSEIMLDAEIKDHAWIAGRSVEVTSSGRLGHDTRIAGQEVIIDAPIAGDLYLAAGNAVLGAEIDGSVHAYVGEIELKPGAVIRGDLFVTGPNPPVISPEAQVLGRIVHRSEGDEEFSLVAWLLRWLGMFLAVSVLGTAVIMLASDWNRRVATRLSGRPGRSLLFGVMSVIVIPLISILLAVTLIGLPLAVVLVAIFISIVVMTSVFVSYGLGSWLLNRLGIENTKHFTRLVSGTLLLAFFASLPWVGWLVQLVVLLLGMGAVVLEAISNRSKLTAGVSA